MKIALLSAGLAFVLTACVLKAPPPRNSRFQADITQMTKVDFHRDTFEYRHPTKKTTDYSEFIIEPLKVYENTPKISEDDRYIFNEFGAAALFVTRKLLSKDYFLTQKPGPNTMRINIEIVDIKPNVKTQSEGLETTRFGSPIKGSKLEANCYDSMSGELIYAVSTLYKGDEYAAYTDTALLENVQKAYDEWTAFFKKRFDRAMKF